MVKMLKSAKYRNNSVLLHLRRISIIKALKSGSNLARLCDSLYYAFSPIDSSKREI